MKQLKVPVANMSKFAGKWVAIDPIKGVIIAVGETLKEIDLLITRSKNDMRPSGTTPAAYKVPYKDEGPYILFF